MKHFILNEDNSVRPATLLEWAFWFERADLKIAFDKLLSGFDVSTVFLGLNYNLGGGEPLLFETMVFRRDDGNSMGKGHAFLCERWATYEEAITGHKEIVEGLK